MNGIFSKRSAAGVLGVVAMMIAVSGCDSDAASSSVPRVSVVKSIPQDWYRGEQPILRYQSDAARSRLWVLTADGVELYEAATGEQMAQVALPGWLWVGRQFACPPDLAIGPRGEAVISSNVVPTLWRVDPVTLVASKHELAIEDDAGRDIGFTALVYSATRGVLRREPLAGVAVADRSAVGEGSERSAFCAAAEACALADVTAPTKTGGEPPWLL